MERSGFLRSLIFDNFLFRRLDDFGGALGVLGWRAHPFARRIVYHLRISRALRVLRFKSHIFLYQILSLRNQMRKLIVLRILGYPAFLTAAPPFPLISLPVRRRILVPLRVSFFSPLSFLCLPRLIFFPLIFYIIVIHNFDIWAFNFLSFLVVLVLRILGHHSDTFLCF